MDKALFGHINSLFPFDEDMGIGRVRSDGYL